MDSQYSFHPAHFSPNGLNPIPQPSHLFHPLYRHERLYQHQHQPNVQQSFYPAYHPNQVLTDHHFPTSAFSIRQHSVKGQATWTDGGRVTQCGIPWSHNQFMTAAVGKNTPYRCGQTLKIRNLSSPFREVIVTVVDQIPNYPANRVSLHRRAFEALGANPSIGVLDVEIIPSPEVEKERWGKYLMELAMTAYPGYKIIEYKSVGKKQVSPQQTQETYEFILQSRNERITLRGTVIYNPRTNRVTSFNLVEV